MKFGSYLKCYYDEKISSRFSSHFESTSVGCSTGEKNCSNYKRAKTVYFNSTSFFLFNSPPLLGVAPADKLSAIWIEEKLTNLNMKCVNAA